MKFTTITAGLALSLTAAVLTLSAQTINAQSSSFKLQSSDIAPQSTIKIEQIFNGFGCTGKNVSPTLSWSGVPAAAKSLALIMHDPDAPTGVGGFTHWMIYNIPVTAMGIAKGAGTLDGKLLPVGAKQAATSFGEAAFGGPCPPMGDKPHEYIFTLYALGTDKLEIPAGASQAFVGFNIVGNSIAKASFSAYFGR